MLNERLSEFEAKLRHQGAAVMERLVQPGHPEDDVSEALLAACGYDPEEPVTWFRWQNGLRERGPDVHQRGALIGAWAPWSLEEAIARSRKRLATSWPGAWPRARVPLVRDYDRELTADGASDSKRAAVIRTGYHGDPNRKVAVSLERLVAAWLRLVTWGCTGTGNERPGTTKRTTSRRLN